MTTLRDHGPSRTHSSSASGPAHWTELSEFEFALIVSWHAFERWVVRCMRAAGLPELGLNDVLVLHQVQHRGREKRLADICFTLGYEDTHVVTYALRKLGTAGLVSARKVGKEMRYSTTPKGDGAIERYRRLRERFLLDRGASRIVETGPDASGCQPAAALASMARRLRAASGWYDQAARAAASL